jgi:hypothetical protein
LTGCPSLARLAAVSDDNDLDARAARLYAAVVAVLSDRQTGGLLAAVADARDRIVWENASPKTRSLFHRLVANLTAKPPAS